jgi:hypothetical protein
MGEETGKELILRQGWRKASRLVGAAFAVRTTAMDNEW